MGADVAIGSLAIILMHIGIYLMFEKSKKTT